MHKYKYIVHLFLKYICMFVFLFTCIQINTQYTHTYIKSKQTYAINKIKLMQLVTINRFGSANRITSIHDIVISSRSSKIYYFICIWRFQSH